MNLTESPDSDCESLSQTEAIITPVLTFSKNKQFHKMTIFLAREMQVFYRIHQMASYILCNYESTNFSRKSLFTHSYVLLVEISTL